MIREKGVVVGVKGGMATVRFERSINCGGCGLCGAPRDAGIVIEAKNEACACIGERVIVECGDVHPLLSAFLIFTLPVIGLCGGFVVGWRVGGSEKAGFAVGAAALLIIFMAVHLYDRSLRRRDRGWPRVISVGRDAPGDSGGGE